MGYEPPDQLPSTAPEADHAGSAQAPPGCTWVFLQRPALLLIQLPVKAWPKTCSPPTPKMNT